MATVNDVFETAMKLVDEVNEAGETLPSRGMADNKEYENRTVSIMNILCQECYPYSDTYQKPKKSGKRSTAAILTSMNDEIDMDDKITLEIMPFGLAGLLFADENATLANFHWQEYKERLMRLKQEGLMSEGGDIEDVYSGYYDANGKWISYGNGIGFEWTTHW